MSVGQIRFNAGIGEVTDRAAGELGLRRGERSLPVATLLLIAGEMDKHQPLIPGLELADDVGGCVRIKLTREEDVVDNDIGVEVFGQVLDAAVEIKVESVAEPKHRVGRMLVNEFEQDWRQVIR